MNITVVKSVDPDIYEFTVRYEEKDLDAALLTNTTPEIKGLFFDLFSNASDKLKISDKITLAAKLALLVETNTPASTLNLQASKENQ